jgi:hypothetical protein
MKAVRFTVVMLYLLAAVAGIAAAEGFRVASKKKEIHEGGLRYA